MRPQPGERNHPKVGGCSSVSKKASGWPFVQVEAKPVPSPQSKELPDEVEGIVLGPGTLGGAGPAGINAYEHRSSAAGASRPVKRTAGARQRETGEAARQLVAQVCDPHRIERASQAVPRPSQHVSNNLAPGSTGTALTDMTSSLHHHPLCRRRNNGIIAPRPRCVNHRAIVTNPAN